jgi:hypothetical protein
VSGCAVRAPDLSAALGDDRIDSWTGDRPMSSFDDIVV